MATDLLLVVADTALREVLQYALQVDGHRVRTAEDQATARHMLADRRAALLVLDGTMPLDGGAVAWAEQHAAGIPLVLLVGAWGESPTLAQRDAVVLPMPFGCAELQRAIAAVCATPARR
jgi:DNA-binding response OmpR family regulator